MIILEIFIIQLQTLEKLASTPGGNDLATTFEVIVWLSPGKMK